MLIYTILKSREDIAKKIYDEGVAILDTFKIYLQTLLSQALDSNFLTEITKENGELSTFKETWLKSYYEPIYHGSCFDQIRLNNIFISMLPDEYFLTSISAVEEHWVSPRTAILSGIITWKKDLLVISFYFFTIDYLWLKFCSIL